MNKLLTVFSAFFLLTFMTAGRVSAAVVVGDDFQGTLVVTSPDGEIELVDAGDAVPQISSGSLVEIFDGIFSLKTEGSDSVEAACLGYIAAVGSGGSVTLSCGEESGLLNVLAGLIKVTDENGNIVELKAGESMQLILSGSPLAAPTADRGEGRGRGLGGGDDSDDDSTNIDDDDDQGDDNDNQDDDSSPK